MTRRSRALAAVALVGAACAGGCGEVPEFRSRAVYGPELEFRATADRDTFDELVWSDVPRKAPKCPLVLHTSAGAFGDEPMGSIAAMRRLEARVIRAEPGRRKEKVSLTVLNIDRDRARVTTYYHDERLVSVIVRAAGPTRVTLGDRSFALPLARGALFETFGAPAKLIE